IVFRCSGYWPMISSAKTIFKILNYLLRIFNLTIFLFLTSIIIGDAISNFDDLSLITDNLCFLIGCFEVASKAFKFTTEYKNIMLLIKDIYEPFDMLKTMDNLEVMTQINSLARFEIKQASILIGLVTLLVIARIFGADRTAKQFPVRAYFPFDSSTSPRYQLLYLAVSYGVIFIDFSLFAFDMVIVVIMRYLTFHLKILLANYRHCHVKPIETTDDNLSSDLKVIGKYDAITHANNEDDDDQKEDIENFVFFKLNNEDVNKINTFDWRLKQCIMHHQKIVKMTTILNDCFSFCVVIQIMASTILICLNGFQILLANDDTHLFLRRIMAIFTVLLQLFFWCWYGNSMSTVADALTYNQWMCGWENEFKRGVSNSVTTSMVLSLRSLELRAMGLVPLSLQTFVSAMKTSYSVLILLLTVVED
ncbi:GSCOCT00010941001.3-RA-CDS, partial [Cotesia congregata]